MNEIVDEDINYLLNNYACLNQSQKKDLLWFSEAVKSKK